MVGRPTPREQAVGRVEVARLKLEAARRSCRARGVDPDLSPHVATLAARLAAAEAAAGPMAPPRDLPPRRDLDGPDNPEE